MDGQSHPAGAAKPRSNNRRTQILDAAALRFRTQGYAATTMRDIATDAGMLAGSLYYHFSSKSQLLIAVHEEGVKRIADAVDEAIAKSKAGDAWGRLETALCAHLESLLSGGDYAQVIIRDIPADEPDLKDTLIALRDDYEQRMRTLVDGLPLKSKEDARWIRLLLLGAANWSPNWYRPDGASPAEIARNYIRLLKSEQVGA